MSRRHWRGAASRSWRGWMRRSVRTMWLSSRALVAVEARFFRRSRTASDGVAGGATGSGVSAELISAGCGMRSSSGTITELLQHADLVNHCPVLDRLPARQAEDVRFSPGGVLARSGHPHKIPLHRAAGSRVLRHPVAFRHAELDRVMQVGEGRLEALHKLNAAVARLRHARGHLVVDGSGRQAKLHQHA
jgi:hypothetical protein